MPTMPGKDGTRVEISENMYVQIFRKQLAVFRHRIYMHLKNTGGRLSDPAAIEK